MSSNRFLTSTILLGRVTHGSMFGGSIFVFAMYPEIKKFNFIKDEPIMPGKPGYFDFYHSSFSPALKDMILSDSCPHTIGLFSKWGTGKSSIVDKLEVDLRGEPNTHVFIFDAWKYQEDSLRRTFLIKLEKYLKSKGYEIPEDILSAFYKNKVSSVLTSKEVVEEKLGKKRNFFCKVWDQYKLVITFLIAPFLLGVASYILGDIYPENKFVTGSKSFFAYINSLAWLGLIAGIFLKPIAERALEKITSKIFESTKTYTEIRTLTEGEERLNSPEQFESVFGLLVTKINKGKLVIVFDNVDRVQGDVALKILSTIKTFLDVGKRNVIFLIPCDAGAINKQIRAFYNSQHVLDPDFEESEYLKKLFNVVLNTPEFIDEDLYEYTNALIDQTGDDIKKVIKKEEVLSVITRAFKNNPREIKQFINNLVSAVLVASKTPVAETILAETCIGYFTKVTILKQKFPRAYERLKENWNQSENILDEKSNEAEDLKLREFLTLTSTITTEDAEPFIYLKKPEIELTLNDASGIRKALVEGNTEEFERLAALETDKLKLVQYVARLLRNYKGQSKILLPIFKSQIQGFSNLKEVANNTSAYLEASIAAIELIWNYYLQLPTSAIFELLPRLDSNKRSAVINRYIAVLSGEDVRIDGNTTFLHNVIDEFIKSASILAMDQKQRIIDAIRQNLGTRNDVLLKFDTQEKQRNFVDPEVLRKIIQEILTNQNLKSFMPLFGLYQQFIIDANLSQLLLQRMPKFMSIQNSETPSASVAKVEFYSNSNVLLAAFNDNIKELAVTDQKEIFNNLQNAFNQSSQSDAIQQNVVIALRWLEVSVLDAAIRKQAKDLIDTYITQSTRDALEKVLIYWNEQSRQGFVDDHFDYIKNRSVQNDPILALFYENADEARGLQLIQHAITGNPDHALAFLRTLSEKIPSRQEVIASLLAKAQTLPIQRRIDIFNFLKEKIAKNDDVNLKQSAIRQFYEYLKSTEQSMVQFGATMLQEPFLSDTDEREIAKEMLEFYNTRASHLQPSDLPVIEYMVSIESKLQEPLREKLVFLILNNIDQDRSGEILKPLLSFIERMKPNSDVYEKDYSDLVQRLLVWPDGEQKNQLSKDVFGLLGTIAGNKTKEYTEKIRALVEKQ